MLRHLRQAELRVGGEPDLHADSMVTAQKPMTSPFDRDRRWSMAGRMLMRSNVTFMMVCLLSQTRVVRRHLPDGSSTEDVTVNDDDFSRPLRGTDLICARRLPGARLDERGRGRGAGSVGAAQPTDTGDVDNLTGWLTTVVGRVCLDMLRSRASRREDPMDVRLPDPVVDPADGGDPEHEAVMADSVGLALLVVLETLGPAERLAFVLHDLFAVPFEDIAPIVGRTPTATRQLASRARRRVQGGAPVPDDLPRQREVVDAFTAPRGAVTSPRCSRSSTPIWLCVRTLVTASAANLEARRPGRKARPLTGTWRAWFSRRWSTAMLVSSWSRADDCPGH